MKLHYSPTSPYTRKVTVTAHETGLHSRIELAPTNPWDKSSELCADNPLGKVPTLITDEGWALFDSPVICEYLDSLHNDAKLFPASGAERWQALRQQALADGILDAAVLVFVERKRRPEQYYWSDWIDFQMSTVRRSLDAMEGEAAAFGEQATIGQIAAACALGYLDFRFTEENWRQQRFKLAAWYEKFSTRPSMVATVPKDPV